MSRLEELDPELEHGGRCCLGLIILSVLATLALTLALIL